MEADEAHKVWRSGRHTLHNPPAIGLIPSLPATYRPFEVFKLQSPIRLAVSGSPSPESGLFKDWYLLSDTESENSFYVSLF